MHTATVRLFWIGVLLVCGPVCTQAASPVHWIQTAARRTFNTRDGLVTSSISRIRQTRDGYLWIGGSAGLARFDGSRFVTFDQRSTPQFSSSTISDMEEDEQGTLWIATRSPVLLAYRNGRFETEAAGVPVVKELSTHPDGSLYLGSERGLFVRRKGRTEPLTQTGLPADEVSSIWVAPDKAIWIGFSERGVWRLQGDRAEPIPTGGGWPGRAHSIVGSPDGRRVWFATVAGLQEWRAETGTVSRVNRASLFALALDREGTLWALETTGTVLARQGDRDFRRTLFPKQVRLFEGDVAVDSEGNLWIGHEFGLDWLSESRFRQAGLPEGLSDDMIFSVTRRRGGGYFAGTEFGLHVLDGEGRVERTLTKKTGLRDSAVFAIWEEENGDLAVGSEAGLTFIRQGRYQVFDGSNFGAVMAILRSRTGQLWIGSYLQGLLRWTDSNYESFSTDRGLPDRAVTALAEDHSGTIWAGTRAGLSSVQNGEVKIWDSRHGIPAGPVHSLLCDREQQIWAGTATGLYRYDPRKSPPFERVAAIPFDDVGQLQEDDAGNLWMSSSQGIIRASIADLRAQRRDPGRAIRVTRMDESDGLRRSGSLLLGQKAQGVTTRDGVVFGTLGGIAWPTGAAFRTDSSQPPAVIEQILLNGEPVSPATRLRIPAGVRRIEVQYTGIWFSGAQRLRFAYRLDGFEPDWVEAGNRRTATYTNLDPGRYFFQLRVANRDGIWQPGIARVEFDIQPEFWQTTWFRTGTGLSLSLVTMGLLRRRERMLRERFEIVLRERKRIARDLHDTLLQGFAGISFQVKSLVLRVPPDQLRLKQELDSALRRIDDCLVEARQAIADLRDGDPAAQNLTTRLQQLSQARPGAPPLQVQLEGEPYPLPYQFELNLYMVAREAVNNAIVHSGAARVEISVLYGREEITIRIRDDGQGFALQDRYAGHWGIQGMRERMEALGGELRIDSARGQGTEVIARVRCREKTRDPA